MNEIIALQKYENEAQLAKELIRGFLAGSMVDYVINRRRGRGESCCLDRQRACVLFYLKRRDPHWICASRKPRAEVDWIEDLFVLPEYQGNGYGSHAIALVEAEIKSILNLSILR